jgi:hypothetical protein
VSVDAFSTPRLRFNIEVGADFECIIEIGSELTIPSSELVPFLVNVLTDFGWKQVLCNAKKWMSRY